MQRVTFIFLHALSSIQFWLSRRLTNVGKFTLAGLVIAAAVGIDTDLTLSHQIFTLLVALFLFSFISNLRFGINFEAERLLPPFVTAGETFQYQINISNLSNDTKEGLLLIEMLADPRPTYDEFILTSQNNNSSRGYFVNSYYRWKSLIAENQNGTIQEYSLPRLLNKHVTELSIEANAEHRGHIEFTDTAIARLDPLGLIKTFVKVSTRQSLLVLPKRYTIPELQLPGKRIYQHGGVTLAASKGDTEEFIGLRDYREGDPLQHIHWKSFARIGKPVVKEYQDEFFERYALVVDTFTKAGINKIFEEAISLAASFACTIETQENLLDLMFVGVEAYTFTAGVGQLHTDSLLEILSCVRACEDKSFHELRKSVLERRNCLSGCILIFTSWDGARQQMVDELTALELPLEIFIIKEDEDATKDEDTGHHTLIVNKMTEGLANL